MTVHERFEFHMPASCEVVFDVFHYHEWRQRWDSLVRATHVLNGAPCPYVGALSSNAGGGLLSGLSMHTRFISYVRPQLAAAKMEGRSFPFARWAASMRHRPLSDGESVMIYTYSFDVAPPWLRWAFEPVVKLVFDWQTRKRFGRMQRFLRVHADEVQRWQRSAMPG
jgi:hypothetical protein